VYRQTGQKSTRMRRHQPYSLDIIVHYAKKLRTLFSKPCRVFSGLSRVAMPDAGAIACSTLKFQMDAISEYLIFQLASYSISMIAALMTISNIRFIYASHMEAESHDKNDKADGFHWTDFNAVIDNLNGLRLGE
jgi:hypothetical protein